MHSGSSSIGRTRSTKTAQKSSSVLKESSPKMFSCMSIWWTARSHSEASLLGSTCHHLPSENLASPHESPWDPGALPTHWYLYNNDVHPQELIGNFSSPKLVLMARNRIEQCMDVLVVVPPCSISPTSLYHRLWHEAVHKHPQMLKMHDPVNLDSLAEQEAKPLSRQSSYHQRCPSCRQRQAFRFALQPHACRHHWLSQTWGNHGRTWHQSHAIGPGRLSYYQLFADSSPGKSYCFGERWASLPHPTGLWSRVSSWPQQPLPTSRVPRPPFRLVSIASIASINERKAKGGLSEKELWQVYSNRPTCVEQDMCTKIHFHLAHQSFDITPALRKNAANVLHSSCTARISEITMHVKIRNKECQIRTNWSMTLQVNACTGLYDNLVYNKLKVVRDTILESWWCLLLCLHSCDQYSEPIATLFKLSYMSKLAFLCSSFALWSYDLICRAVSMLPSSRICRPPWFNSRQISSLDSNYFHDWKRLKTAQAKGPKARQPSLFYPFSSSMLWRERSGPVFSVRHYLSTDRLEDTWLRKWFFCTKLFALVVVWFSLPPHGMTSCSNDNIIDVICKMGLTGMAEATATVRVVVLDHAAARTRNNRSSHHLPQQHTVRLIYIPPKNGLGTWRSLWAWKSWCNSESM